MGRPKLFIDATPLLDYRLSGIGHTILSTVREIAEGAHFTNYDVYLIVPYFKRDRLDRFHLRNVRVKSVPLLARVWNVWPRLSFMPPIDIFLGKGVYLFMNYKKWPLLFSKSVTYVYDANYSLYPSYVEPRNLRMLERNLARWMAQSDRLVTISEASKAELVQYAHAPADKMEVIYGGVDAKLMHPMPREAVERVKKKYGITKKYLFFLSNIEPRKNIKNLLSALDRLPKEYKEKYALVLVGGMSWSNETIMSAIDRTRAGGWDIIKPSSYVPDEDLPALLTGTEVLVHPAFHEGFGLSPLQALACGTRVAVSDLPVMHETVGNEGVYFDPHDPQSIADALRGILSHTPSQTAVNALRRRAGRFSWDMAAQKLSELIGKL